MVSGVPNPPRAILRFVVAEGTVLPFSYEPGTTSRTALPPDTIRGKLGALDTVRVILWLLSGSQGLLSPTAGRLQAPPEPYPLEFQRSFAGRARCLRPRLNFYPAKTGDRVWGFPLSALCGVRPDAKRYAMGVPPVPTLCN